MIGYIIRKQTSQRRHKRKKEKLKLKADSQWRSTGTTNCVNQSKNNDRNGMKKKSKYFVNWFFFFNFVVILITIGVGQLRKCRIVISWNTQQKWWIWHIYHTIMPCHRFWVAALRLIVSHLINSNSNDKDENELNAWNECQARQTVPKTVRWYQNELGRECIWSCI